MGVADRRLNRCVGWDYSSRGWYFVTIDAGNKGNIFGKIYEGEMVRNDWGRIIKDCWIEIPNHFKGIYLDEYVIMPDHMHGIINIVGVAYKLEGQNYSEGQHICCPNNNNDKNMDRWQERSKMLISKVIQNFKAAVSREIGKSLWQRSFHDEIIRNDMQLNRIREYIRNNPKNWRNNEMVDGQHICCPYENNDKIK